MSGTRTTMPGQLERELAYYQRECNDLGARLLRLQEEQSAGFREARRSRMVAKLIREAYRLADAGSSPDSIGSPMLGIIIENVMCDGAAFLSEERPGTGAFTVTHAVGVPRRPDQDAVVIMNPPDCFFTTSQTTLEPVAYALTSLLHLPYILWSYDRASGHALILGNRSESNVSRAFEAGDQELTEGALSVYLDVLGRKQAEVELRQAKANLEQAISLKTGFLDAIGERLAGPLDVIIRSSAPLCRDGSATLSETDRERYVRQIADSREQLRTLFGDLLNPGRALPEGTTQATERLSRAEGVSRDAPTNTRPAARGPHPGNLDRFGRSERSR